LGSHNHRQVAADTTPDKADEFRLGVIMVIDVALREIDTRPEFLQRMLEAFGRCDCAERTDERVLQSLERQLFASENILKMERFMGAFDNFRGTIVTADAFH